MAHAGISISLEEFSARLAAAVARHIGPPGTIFDLQRLTGGATKSTWSFDADVAGARNPFILQLASSHSPVPDPLAGITPHLTAEEDARVMIAAVRGGVPAPRVRAILGEPDGLDPGYITERIPGESLGARIARDDRFAKARSVMASQCGTILAAIHRLDPAELPFLTPQSAQQMLAAQYQIVDHYGFRLPALELGLRWAAENLPKNPRNTVIHGDFRNGNLIAGEEDGIRCILDWEIAGIGDPMYDLGWLCVKTWRFGGRNPVGGFGSREDLFAAYEAASGLSVDPAHVRFWEAFGCIRWAVICLQKGLRFTDATEPISIEQSAIGRRTEEPLWDFLNLIEDRA